MKKYFVSISLALFGLLSPIPDINSLFSLRSCGWVNNAECIYFVFISLSELCLSLWTLIAVPATALTV